MKTIKNLIKKAMNWYVKQYYDAYGPILRAGISPCI